MSKSAPLQFSKANFQVLEQERDLLKITLEFLSKENEQLKLQLEDMQMTVKHNKEQLDEYVTTITSKDKMFEKMASQIEQLTNRLKSLESRDKKSSRSKIDHSSKKKSMNELRPYTQNNSTNNSNSGAFPNNNVISVRASQNQKNEEKFKEFFDKQGEIFDEMDIIKNDIQFLIENKSKTKLREHLEQSISSERSNSYYFY